MLSQQQVLSYGREVLSQESQAIKEAGDRLGQSFFQAVNLLFTCKGKVVTTGMGKSVLLATMAMQFRRYENAQVFAFDFGGSIRAATLAAAPARRPRRAASRILRPAA